ncbi:MAG: right-handed parallel beta-helix repeat-containing protein, partial [Thermoplasmata archaeon]|nr:right-handed parallel beta-helix repeat-containing protein [Thermoplasmata archaeon]
MKKSILVALALLTSFFATIAIIPETARATTYFVGGTGLGNYTTIQAAVNVAGLGDTVYVYNGIYRETPVISGAIRLVGESRDTTIIDAQNTQNTITVNSDSVKISGFTITNGNLGIRLMSVDNCEIFSNVISNNGDGAIISDSVGCIIRDNIISSNRYDGIDLSVSGSSLIANNVVSSNGDYGIRISSSVGNVIMDNHVSSNEHGIYLDSSNSNDIIGNTAWSNDYSGSLPGAGI